MRRVLSINGPPKMLTRLKGINKVRKRLADGSFTLHYYLGRGKGAVKLDGKPGSPEFMASYNAALTQIKIAPTGNLKGLLRAYEVSAEYKRLAVRTQLDYSQKITRIVDKFGTFPLKALADKRTRGLFLVWRDELARSSPRQADYVLMVLSIALTWAGPEGRGMIDANPLAKYKKLYSGSRAESVWSDDDESRLMAVASQPLQMALQLALWTGQRQGDLLRLPWSAYDGQRIRLKQSKGGKRVDIPVAGPLKAMLDAVPRVSTIILTNQDSVPWTADGFRSSWHKACKRAAITGLTFHDLRGTAVTRLAVAGCNDIEISSITGHSIGDVKSILEKHYLKHDPRIATAAIEKLERYRSEQKTANRLQTAATVSVTKTEKDQ
jgi:integrase